MRVAIVGDVHDQWSPRDAACLRALDAIANLPADIPKAVILGNHDALPNKGISLVGARPFSKGGKSLRSIRDFMARFGVLDMKDSTDKILNVINTQAGDHGDPDLQEVLHKLHQAGRPPALVVFGHMHHQLQGGGRRQMVHVDQQTGTVFLNAATVPRVQIQPMKGAGPRADSKHHFLVVDLDDGRVAAAANVSGQQLSYHILST
eukprot:gene13812-13933_t